MSCVTSGIFQPGPRDGQAQSRLRFKLCNSSSRLYVRVRAYDNYPHNAFLVHQQRNFEQRMFALLPAVIAGSTSNLAVHYLDNPSPLSPSAPEACSMRSSVYFLNNASFWQSSSDYLACKWNVCVKAALHHQASRLIPRRVWRLESTWTIFIPVALLY